MPLPAMNPGGFDHRVTSWATEFSLADIRGVLNDSTGEPAASPPLGVRAAARLRSSVKARIEAALDAVYPASDAAVLKGVFLGDRRCLAPEDSRDFRVSGFYRFIAVSGFHIELLSSLCEKASGGSPGARLLKVRDRSRGFRIRSLSVLPALSAPLSLPP